MKRLLIVETSPPLRDSLRIILTNEYEVISLSALLEGISLLKREKIDLVILGVDDSTWDMRDLVEELVDVKQDTPLMLMGKHHLLETYRRFLEGYVEGSIILPFRIFEVRERVKQILSGGVSPFLERSHENRRIEKYQRLYNSSLVESRIKRVIPKMFGGKSPILLSGERGTGREAIAKIIHYLGSKNAGAFIKFDCTSLTEDGLISRLKTMIPPSLSANSEVSLYWDEIGRLSPEIQTRVEEILEEGINIISHQSLPIFPRIIASSSEDLNEVMVRGKFREGLLYRLNYFPLHIRPLRERIDDLPAIARELIDNLSEKAFVKKKQISPEAIELLKAYYWPGNIRELESVILRSCLLSEGEIITREDVSFTGEENATGEVREKIFSTSSMSEETETVFEQLLEGLAHEIKNPLVAIKTFTQLLSERFDDAEFRKQFYQIVGRSIDRIDWLTKRVLEYTNFLKAHIIPLNFFALLEHVITEHQVKLHEKKITIQKDGLESFSSSMILSDSRQINYALENILVHCVNDLPEGSHVVFSARIARLEENEERFFPLKDFLNHRIMTLKVSLPVLPHISPGGVAVSLARPRFYSLELFLSQEIINRNLGIMEKTGGEGAAVLTIKLPMSKG